MTKSKQVDAFDGVFDVLGATPKDDRREKWRDGRLITQFAGSMARSGAFPPLAKQFDMLGAWGSFPDRPGSRKQESNQ